MGRRSDVVLSWLALSVMTWALGAHAAEPKQPERKIPPAATGPVDFVRDIQPIFAERCNHCHGEDDQQGQLRLDARAIVLRGGQSGPLLVTGKSDQSLLIHRVVGLGTEKQMPLEDDPLSEREIGLLRAWIDQGAKWPAGVGSAATEIKKHWAYVAPVSPKLPAVQNASWLANPVDAFVLARLEQEKLAPSPPADREQLIRRVSLDLVGLPPSVAQVDAFLADQSPDAYDRLVDRLVASPHYGERWATPWLDAARYADSNGYQRDGHRVVWPYRDWVIRSLNADLPFDQFTIEQLAGDLLPNATLEQKIATGFHRGTTVNVEAGTDEEENRTNQVIDRVNVTGTVWLGSTLECCQCHNHKYDPFSQRDYYRLFAYFNNTPKETYQRSKGSAALDFAGPEVQLPADSTLLQRRESLAARRSEIEAELAQCLADEKAGLAAWEQEMADASQAKGAKLPANIRKLLAVPVPQRKPKQQAELRDYFISQHLPARQMQAEMTRLQQEQQALVPATSLVMTELAEPRLTTIFQRGSFLTPGEQVEPGTPSVLPRLSAAAPANRLGLAQWIVDRSNPLTARVQVNRAWAQFFGRGIVASEEDFGTQSEPATHPELLDWLAVEFRDATGPRSKVQSLTSDAGSTLDIGLRTLDSSRWSMKRIHRKIVESAAYRQSSKFRSDLLRKDPYNLLVARGTRVRLSAEQIRDNALVASGQFIPKMHGPPTHPPQPEGIWRVTGAVDNTYRTSQGEDAWRRGVYTVWRRSGMYPSFGTFDAPDRSACMVKRPRSNSPLQALTLLNDPVYVELARALADRLVEEFPTQARNASEGTPSASLDQQLIHAFRTVLSRRPDAEELAQLRSILTAARERYADAKQANLIAGKRALPAGTTAADWAAWFDVSHVLLNLDETITKN